MMNCRPSVQDLQGLEARAYYLHTFWHDQQFFSQLPQSCPALRAKLMSISMYNTIQPLLELNSKQISTMNWI